MASARRFWFFIPQLFWTGVSISFFSGNLVEIMAATIEGDDQTKFMKAIYPMILFGVGEILGCFFIGFIVDKYGSRPAAFCNIIIMLLMTGATSAYCIVYDYSWLAYVMCFLWGF